MRFSFSAVLAAFALFVQSAAGADAASWQPATATSVTAGAGHSNFMIQASVTLPKSCYAARIRSTPISLQAPRSFDIEQMAPSSSCSGNSYTCTVVSPAFPLPIPHMIDVYSAGPKKWKVAVHTTEPVPVPPICRKS